MKVQIKRTDTYVPKWNGNRKLPESEQVKVHYHFLSFEEQERLVKVDENNKTVLNFAGGVASQVDTIDNLTVEADGEEKAITTGGELVAEPAVADLAMEVWRHLQSLDPMSAAKS
jgi:hypothetical protein